MTKREAAKELGSVMDKWLDFYYWAYLQLEMQGGWSQERLTEVLVNHKRADDRLNAFHKELEEQDIKMREKGATDDEVNAYFRSRDDELHKLVAAWRSLDGLSE
jgi:hypothetical protein